MGRLVYSAICSLDGHVTDADGGFDWAAPDAEVHAFVNEQERPVGTYLYGRAMYQTMRAWQDPPTGPGATPETLEYAGLWQAADKVVFSRTLSEVDAPRTELRAAFDPAAVATLVASTDGLLSIGGPTLAAHALAAGVVDELQLYLVPALVGGGTPALPPGVRRDLRLRQEHRFAGGTVFLRYDL